MQPLSTTAQHTMTVQLHSLTAHNVVTGTAATPPGNGGAHLAAAQQLRLELLEGDLLRLGPGVHQHLRL
jgi:hypothetical protein